MQTGTMRIYRAIAVLTLLVSLGWSQQPTAPAKAAPAKPDSTRGAGAGDSALTDLFQAKIKAEWEAIKNKDKKAYGDLLADDFQGVEVDARGERNKLQALNEMTETNVVNYTLWGLKVIPVGANGALVIYEVTMQFPPKSVVRLSRIYISALWMKRAGQWKEVHYQETHVK